MELNKLYNEDCLVTMSKMPNKYINVTITSPPYNFDNGSGLGNKYNKQINDRQTQEEYYEWSLKVIKELIRVSEIVCWNIQMVAGNKVALLKYIGYFANEISEILIWDKLNSEPAINEKVFNSEFEFILIFANNKAKRKIEQVQFKKGTQSNIIRIAKNKNKNNVIHLACFPEELPSKLIHLFSKENDIIYDPFSGTGTTLTCAYKYKRKFIGSELVKDYYDYANKNIERHINQKQIF